MDIYTTLVTMIIALTVFFIGIYSIASAILFPKFLMDSMSNLYEMVVEIIRQKRHEEAIRRSDWFEYNWDYFKHNLGRSGLFFLGFIIFVLSIMSVLMGEVMVTW